MKTFQAQLANIKRGITGTAVKITKKKATEMLKSIGHGNIRPFELRDMTFIIIENPGYVCKSLSLAYIKPNWENYCLYPNTNRLDLDNLTLKDFSL